MDMDEKEREIADKLEYLRGELRAERISYGELAELQCLAAHIDPGDVELLEAAGVPEFEGACAHCKRRKAVCYESADGKHDADPKSIQIAVGAADFTVDVGCRRCGISGATTIDPNDIAWE